ncbi:methionine synthase, partial [Streptomyces sp. SID7982]|nr:methionine synthase [Streptomyces sp. SID7982]
RTYRAVDRQAVESALRDVLAAAGEDGTTLVHSCAPEVPVALLRRAGADGVSLDFSLLTEREEEAIGEAVEGGT